MYDLNETLNAYCEAGLRRTRKIVNSAQGKYLSIDGREVLNFCSNDYLNLANDPRLVESLQKAASQAGVGSGAAHLICGHHRFHHQLEEALADFLQFPRALLFSTGYMANLGVITALLDKKDVVLEDRLNHASLIDGGIYSGARLRRYHHANIEDLKHKLETSTAQRKLIVSDGVFSMDGDIAPITQLVECAKQHRAGLMVDDAHGIGVIGEQGRGSLEICNINSNSIDVLMGTLGKGFGVFGAFVAGSEALVETLIQSARSYVYTTALPPALAAAGLTSLKIIKNEPWRRIHLKTLVQKFRLGIAETGLPLMASQSPIQPILIGGSEEAVKLSKGLLDKGILVSAIRPPTVPRGTARLRVTLTATHTEEDVDRLINTLAEIQP